MFLGVPVAGHGSDMATRQHSLLGYGARRTVLVAASQAGVALGTRQLRTVLLAPAEEEKNDAPRTQNKASFSAPDGEKSRGKIEM